MKYSHLGRSGLLVSKLCLGTMNFGTLTSEPDSQVIMDRALESGVNFVDTANAYGRSVSFGFTEEVIGRWFAQGGGRRDRVVLATKVFAPIGDHPNEGKLSAYHIRKACDDSLRRLQTDHIDLYQMHHIDRESPWEEVWQAMEQLVQAGKVTYVGSSNFAAWNIVQANEIAKSRHFMGLISEQSLYNLNMRMIELEVIPACKAYGLGVIPWSPLAGGLLGGALKSYSEGRRSHIAEVIERNHDKLEAYESLCDELGERPADIALGWLLSNPVVTAPIIGPRTLEQFTETLRALEIELSEDTLGRLNTIFPGPGGQAPEAYAW